MPVYQLFIEIFINAVNAGMLMGPLQGEAPYDTSSSMPGLAETDRYSSVVQLKNWVDLGTYAKDSVSVQNGVEAVKEAILQYGAVMASYYDDTKDKVSYATRMAKSTIKVTNALGAAQKKVSIKAVAKKLEAAIS